MLHEINEMGEDVAFGRGQHCGVDVGIDSGREIGGAARRVVQRVEDRRLAVAAVRDQPVEATGRIAHRRAVARVEDAGPTRAEAPRCRHEGRDVPVRRRDEGRGPAEHVISRKHRVAKREGEVPGEMPRRVEHPEPEVSDADPVGLPEGPVRPETLVDAFAAAEAALGGKARHHGTAAGLGRAEGADRRAGLPRQAPGERRMVPVRVGDEDRGEPRGADEPQKRCQMRGIVRPRVDHGEVIGSDEIGVRPPEGHRRGIGREDEPDARFEFHRHPGVGTLHALFLSARPLTRVHAMKLDWLKAYTPRSLMGRAALILLLPIVTIQLVVGVVFIQRHYENVTRQMTQNIMLDLRYIAREIDGVADAAAAQTALEPVLGPLQIDVAFDPGPVADRRLWYDLSGRVLIETLSRLGGVTGVDLVAEPGRVVFGLETAHGPVTGVFERGRVVARNPHQLLVLMVFVSLILTLISFLFLKNQIRPIRRLAEVAQDFGRGRSVPYRPSGATEVRAAGSAFLDMRQRIERHIEQRTLMLSGVSHDLRTPLTRLKLGLSMLEGDAEVEDLERDVDDMERMLDTFLDFARIGALDDPAEIDPVAFARDAVADAARGGGAAVFAGSEGRGVVSIRPMAARRALDNLIGNALRHGSRAEVSVSLMDRSVRFTVEDDGPGIPLDAREVALKPFARLDTARNQNSGTGVGLGLAIAADIARQHGGVLRLGESERLGGLRADLVLAR